MTLRSAVDADGRFLAHTMDVVFDGGAYAATKIGPACCPAACFRAWRPYRVPHVRMEARAVYTNNMPGGIMRSPGELQGVWAAESHVDMIARELGLDPIEFRLRNITRDGDTDVTGATVHVPQGAAVLRALASGARRDDRTAPGHGRGIGLGTRHVGDGRSQMRVHAAARCAHQVETGLPDQGAGSHTVAQRVVAAALGVDAARVSVKYASTLGRRVRLGRRRQQEHPRHRRGRQCRPAPSSRSVCRSWPPKSWAGRRTKSSSAGDRFVVGSESASLRGGRRAHRARRAGGGRGHAYVPSRRTPRASATPTSPRLPSKSTVDPDTGQVDADRRAAGGRRRHDHQSRRARGPAQRRLRLRPGRGDDGGSGGRRTGAC